MGCFSHLWKYLFLLYYNIAIGCLKFSLEWKANTAPWRRRWIHLSLKFLLTKKRSWSKSLEKITVSVVILLTAMKVFTTSFPFLAYHQILLCCYIKWYSLNIIYTKHQNIIFNRFFFFFNSKEWTGGYTIFSSTRVLFQENGWLNNFLRTMVSLYTTPLLD